jgi:hypothetical protein
MQGVEPIFYVCRFDPFKSCTTAGTETLPLLKFAISSRAQEPGGQGCDV